MWIAIIIGATLIIFISVLVIRTLAFKPAVSAVPDIVDVAVDADEVTQHLAAMVRCKTVSSKDESLTDIMEFEKFRGLLKKLYPGVHKTCKPEHIGPSGLLFTFKGKSSEAPAVFMSHYDVVTAEDAAWDKPPFEGIVEDGVLWGRGTLDTKGTLCGVMEAAEALVKDGFVPENDIYLAFSGDEEIAGETAPAMVAELEKRGIVPVLVVDEGGAVVENIFPGVTRPCALIGTAEKGMLDLKLDIKSQGGHASAPPPHTLIGELSKAVVKIENKPFKARLTPPIAAMFDTLGRHSSFVYRMIFANLWCFLPVLDRLCRKSGGELNAMMRTTCAFTMMSGSNATNILPPAAMMGANLRIIGGDTYEGAVEYLKSVAGNPGIEFNTVYGMNPSRASLTSGPVWERLKGAVAQTWPEAIVSPYLMVACSDSRHYCRISDGVYRFSAMTLSKEERGYIHGHNERITVKSLTKIVQFYSRLMRNC